jgi:hypothetical protein
MHTAHSFDTPNAPWHSQMTTMEPSRGMANKGRSNMGERGWWAGGMDKVRSDHNGKLIRCKIWVLALETILRSTRDTEVFTSRK